MSDFTDKSILTQLDLETFAPGIIHKAWFHIISDPSGLPMLIPLLIARSKKAGPVLGITAAVHGNELNGIPAIQRLFKELDLDQLSGTVVGVPVVNMPSFVRKKRRFVDGKDLNHIFPGKKAGNVSEIYVERFFTQIVQKFDYLIDLHTASFGRINSYYIRADMSDQVTADLAYLQNAQIIVNNPPSDGTLRGAADEIGIPAITLEVGNPNTFQKGMIRSGLTGLHNAMIYLNMAPGEIDQPDTPAVFCERSYWIYTERGGLLSVLPQVAQLVKKDELIAVQHNLFGDKIASYYAPEDGIVIGKSTSPVNQTGGRILHFGIPKS